MKFYYFKYPEIKFQSYILQSKWTTLDLAIKSGSRIFQMRKIEYKSFIYCSCGRIFPKFNDAIFDEWCEICFFVAIDFNRNIICFRILLNLPGIFNMYSLVILNRWSADIFSVILTISISLTDTSLSCKSINLLRPKKFLGLQIG